MKNSLNHVFHTIWSDALNTWVAVSELTSAKGKRSGSSVLGVAALAGNFSKREKRLRLAPVFIALACCYGLSAQANPIGAQVVNGTAAISQVGSVLTVTNTPNAIINWQGFSINAGETTRFIQQSSSSAVLNRVVGPDPSALLGTLTSNGRVFLINPAGIMVGQGAMINVPGFVASTLNLSNADFLAGKLNFGPTLNAGSIQNNGTITTPEGGSVYLVAPQVENNGIITTPKGETILAAGDTVTLIDTGTPGVTVQITGSSNIATNLGQVIADTGRIGMVGAMVRNSGTLNANSMVSQGGRVFLKATVRTEAGGTITSNGSTGGTIELLGNQVGVMDGAAVSANGTSGGGMVLVGGDYQGRNPNIQNAQVSYVSSTARISADATDSGNGGKVVVWADDTTRFYGNISARGGVNGGNGGFVETSGHNYIDFQGNVDTSAPLGVNGNLLIDPSDITISTAADNLLGGSFTTGWFTGATGAANISWATIQTQLNTNSVEIRTSAGSSGTGLITVSGSATLTGANYLALVANSNIAFSAGASLSTGGELDLIAGWNNTGWAVTAGTGTITFNAGSNINTSGNLKMVAGSNISIADATVKSTGNMTIDLGGNLSLAATNSSTWLQSSGTQTINFTGAGANTMMLTGSATAATTNASAVVQSTGMQTISHSGTLDITLTAGSSSAITQSAYQYTNGVQGSLICSACATFNWAGIEGNGGQSISATTITATGGSGGNGNYASIKNGSTTVAQNITTTGAITLTGGSSGGYYNSAFPNDSVSNEASINSSGSQTINAASITLAGGGGGTTTLGGAMLTAQAAQSITTSGNLNMNGGNSTATGQYGLGAPAVIGEQVGQSITLNVGGNLAMAGGGNAANAALIGGASGSPSISITAATGISMATSSQIGVLTGGPGGILTLMKATSGNITEDSTSNINVATISSMLASAGSISLAGSNKVNTATSLSASGNITNYNSAQTVHITSATSTGGSVTLNTTAGSNLYLGTVSGTIVNATSGGGIYDDNGSGVTNITATTSSTLISTGATLGDLGISADVNTPSITATVSGTYGGISIRSTGATSPTTISLTDSATTNPPATSQGVSFYNLGNNAFTLGANMSFLGGNGDVLISSNGNLTYAGSSTITTTATRTTKLVAGSVLSIGTANLSVAGNLSLVAPTVNINGVTASAGGSATVAATNLTLTDGTLSASNSTSVVVSGDVRINATTSASITAVNNVNLTLSGAASTLYFNEPRATYYGSSKVQSSLPQTVYLSFLGRASGGVMIDGVGTLTTAAAGDGFYTAGSPAAVGAGLVVTYAQQNLAQTIAALTPPAPTTTTTVTTTSTSTTPVVVAPPPPPVVATTSSGATMAGPAGGTIGGTADSFGSSDTSASAGQSASGSSSGNENAKGEGDTAKKDEDAKKKGSTKSEEGNDQGKENNKDKSNAKPEKC